MVGNLSDLQNGKNNKVRHVHGKENMIDLLHVCSVFLDLVYVSIKKQLGLLLKET